MAALDIILKEYVKAELLSGGYYHDGQDNQESSNTNYIQQLHEW